MNLNVTCTRNITLDKMYGCSVSEVDGRSPSETDGIADS